MKQHRYLVILLVLQCLCAVYFFADVAVDLFATDESDEPLEIAAELIVSFGLLLGTLFGVVAFRTVLRQRDLAEQQVKVASGAFGQVVTAKFTEWELTPAERDVALFTIKGLTLAEIAALRGKSEGTIKAQSNAVYRKADVGGRTQLVSLFLDTLIEDPVLP